MIFAFADRRAASLLDGGEAQLAERLRRLLTRVQPSALVGAAASGADLVTLEVTLSLQQPPRIEIVLPTPAGRVPRAFRRAGMARPIRFRDRARRRDRRRP